MTKHIASNLSKGRLEIDHNSRVVRIISKTGSCTIQKYQYSDLDSSDWGYVYEKYIGQKYEEEGFQVEYLGLQGFLDGGMDIVISKDDFKAYIQCKFSTKSCACFGKQKIEWILYKASSFLSKQYKDKIELLACHTNVSTDKKRITGIFSIKKQYPR